MGLQQVRQLRQQGRRQRNSPCSNTWPTTTRPTLSPCTLKMSPSGREIHDDRPRYFLEDRPSRCSVSNPVEVPREPKLSAVTPVRWPVPTRCTTLVNSKWAYNVSRLSPNCSTTPPSIPNSLCRGATVGDNHQRRWSGHHGDRRSNS